MDVCRISRTDQPDIEFQGRLLLRTSGDADVHAEGQRSYNLFLYAGDTGYAPGIEYETSFPEEDSCTIAEVVDSANDVENFFSVFEPVELLNRRAVEAMDASERQQLTRQLFRLYDEQVTVILESLRLHELERQSATQDPPVDSNINPDSNLNPDSNTGENRGLLGRLRLK